MSGTKVTIKSGSGKPRSGSLKKAELAIDLDNMELWTAQTDGGDPQKIVGGDDGAGGGDGGGGGVEYTTQTSDYTLENNQGVIADTTGGTFVVTLPLAPAEGDQVVVADGGDWAVTNLTVLGRNGQTIEGVASNLIMDVGGISVTMVFDGVTWQIYPASGVSAGDGGIEEAPEDSLVYGRSDATWVEVTSGGSESTPTLDAVTTEGSVTTNDITVGGLTSTGSLLASQPDADTDAFAAGTGAGQTNQGPYTVAVGHQAGSVDQEEACVAVGVLAGTTSQGVNAIAIGGSAGADTQGPKSVSIGQQTGQFSQGEKSVAIGAFAGQNSQAGWAVAVGNKAGYQSQGIDAVSVGDEAGYNTQSKWAVAVGQQAGQGFQGEASVAIGRQAGTTNQSDLAVAVGHESGSTSQGVNAVAIGNNSGNLNQSKWAVGFGQEAGYSGQGEASIAIGRQAGRNNQAAGGIIISSSGVPVDSADVGHIIIKSSTSSLRSLPAGGFAMNGDPIIGTRKLMGTLSALRQATMDDTQDIRESLRSAIDELVAGFEQEIATMPVEGEE